MYEAYEMVIRICNGLIIRRDNRHVALGDISYVPGRCPVVALSLFSTACMSEGTFHVLLLIP